MFQVYRSKDKVPFYSLYDHLYDARTLKVIDGNLDDDFTYIKGYVGATHGSNPYIYVSEIVYKSEDGKAYTDYDGCLVDVFDKSLLEPILIPSLSKSDFNNCLVVPVFPPKESGIRPILKTEKAEKAETPKATSTPKSASRPTPGSTPKASPSQNLEELFELLCLRLYGTQPIEIKPPENLLRGKERISIEQFKKMDEKGEFVKFEIEPILQLYEGSHRSDKRTFTCHTKDGRQFICRKKFDPETGKIDRS